MCNLSDPLASKTEVQDKKNLDDVKRSGFTFTTDVITPAVEERSRRLRAGSLCPYCKKHRLDYDGQINLACPECGMISGGCFT